MTRLLELTSKLTPSELKQVEDFAEFLSKKNGHVSHHAGATHVDISGLVGLCKGMGGDRSDDELIREAWDHVVREATK